MIRRAEIRDVKELTALWREFHFASNLKRYATYEESVDGIRDWFTKCVTFRDYICFVVEQDGKLVAFLTGLKNYAYWNPEVTYVHEAAMWVAPAARGKGYGRKLVEHLVAWGVTQGARLVGAGSTQAASPRAVGRLLTKIGFKLEEKIYALEL